MEKSALSGAPLEAGATSRIYVTLEDGRSRELTVTAKEADDLAAKGIDVSALRVHFEHQLRGPAGWLLAVLIASLLVPAMTRQWTDRTKELEFKHALLTNFSDSTSRTIYQARDIVLNSLPESRSTNYLCTIASHKSNLALEKQCYVQRTKEAQAEQKAYDDLKEAWLRKGVGLDATLQAYFPGTHLGTDIGAFVTNVRIYLLLASESSCDGTAARNLVRYLDADHYMNTQPLTTPLKLDECQSKPTGYSYAYSEIGDLLLNRRADIARSILRTNAAGFSTNLTDFLYDSWPFLFVVVIVSASYIVYMYTALKPFINRP